MGVLYVVFPLDQHDTEQMAWLDDQAVAFPRDVSGRNPTADELRAALNGLDGHVVEYSSDEPEGDWAVEVQSTAPARSRDWALLRATSHGEGEVLTNLSFHKGSDALNVLILSRLSERTGPLVLVPDTGHAPLVVWPGRELEEMLSSWEFTAPSKPVDDAPVPLAATAHERTVGD